jgi:hypothetical protein
VGAKCGQLTPAIDLLCDAEGGCVECLGASDCQHLPPDTECATRVCSDGGCQLSYTPSGTMLSLPLQTSGDCRLAVCDGSGGVTLAVDNGDLPNDGDACTIDACQAGIAVFEPKCMPGQQCFNGNCF